MPQANTITVEGLISEHDIPSSGPECDDLLCLRPALGLAPLLETGELEVWLQLGMVSGYQAGEFARPAMDTVVLNDKSSSMSIDMVETNASVNAIIDHLRDDDRLAIVTFDDRAHLFQEPSTVANIDRQALANRVEGIPAAGSANMRAGLEKAYAVARDMDSGPERMTRVILLSCGYPSTQYDGPASFSGIVREGATEGIGLTFFGVLLGFRHDMANELSQHRGGNYYFTKDLSSMVSMFEDEFDFTVTPLAYDLKIGLQVDSEHYELDQLYGIPGEEGSDQTGFEVETAFISKRGGAMVAKLDAKGEVNPKHCAPTSTPRLRRSTTTPCATRSA